MDRGQLCLLLLSGLCGFSLALPRRHFHFIDTSLTWRKAMHYCQEKHTDMATVDDEQDLEELTALAQPWHEFVHLGLLRTWSWSLSENDDHREGEAVYTAWAKQTHYYGSCASIGPSGQWTTTGCPELLNFFCYNGYVSDLSKRFVLGNGSLSWSAAQTYCRTHHTDLARIRNHKENARLQAMAHDRQVWIGMAVGRWFRTDGSRPSYVPLVNAPPNYEEGHRGQLWINSSPPGIIPGHGSDKRAFFCYSAPRNKYWIKLKLSGGSSVNLRDSAVTASIRQWVKTKLSEKGVWKDVKLNWKTPQVKARPEPPVYEVNCVP